jgi:hypothetical protein
VFSLIAIVPDSEFRKPIFTESPEVSTQEATEEPPESPTRLPQPANTNPPTATKTATLNRRPLVRREEVLPSARAELLPFPTV